MTEVYMEYTGRMANGKEKRRALKRMQEKMLLHALHVETLPEISRNPYGKPCIPSLPDFHYSFSDSGEYLALAVSDAEVGLDLQEMVPLRYGALKMAERFFNREEYEELQTVKEPERTQLFFRLWSIKEAYLKYLGVGLSGGLSGYAVSERGHTVGDASWKELPAPDHYVLIICSKDPEKAVIKQTE